MLVKKLRKNLVEQTVKTLLQIAQTSLYTLRTLLQSPKSFLTVFLHNLLGKTAYKKRSEVLKCSNEMQLAQSKLATKRSPKLGSNKSISDLD